MKLSNKGRAYLLLICTSVLSLLSCLVLSACGEGNSTGIASPSSAITSPSSEVTTTIPGVVPTTTLPSIQTSETANSTQATTILQTVFPITPSSAAVTSNLLVHQIDPNKRQPIPSNVVAAFAYGGQAGGGAPDPTKQVVIGWEPGIGTTPPILGRGIAFKAIGFPENSTVTFEVTYGSDGKVFTKTAKSKAENVFGKTMIIADYHAFLYSEGSLTVKATGEDGTFAQATTTVKRDPYINKDSSIKETDYGREKREFKIIYTNLTPNQPELVTLYRESWHFEYYDSWYITPDAQGHYEETIKLPNEANPVGYILNLPKRGEYQNDYLPLNLYIPNFYSLGLEGTTQQGWLHPLEIDQLGNKPGTDFIVRAEGFKPKETAGMGIAYLCVPAGQDWSHYLNATTLNLTADDSGVIAGSFPDQGSKVCPKGAFSAAVHVELGSNEPNGRRTEGVYDIGEIGQHNSTNQLKQNISAVLKKLPAGYSASVKSFNATVEQNGNRRLPASGLINLFIAQAYSAARFDNFNIDLAKLVPANLLAGQSGYAGRSVTYAQVVDALLLKDENAAANILIDTLGGFQKVNNYAKDGGFNQTLLQRKLGQLDPSHENYTSTNDVTELLRWELASAGGSSDPLPSNLSNILQKKRLPNSNSDSILNLFGRYLSVDTEYIQISGQIPGARVTAGCFSIKGRETCVAIMASGLSNEKEAEDIIGHTLEEIYKVLSAQSSPTPVATNIVLSSNPSAGKTEPTKLPINTIKVSNSPALSNSDGTSSSGTPSLTAATKNLKLKSTFQSSDTDTGDKKSILGMAVSWDGKVIASSSVAGKADKVILREAESGKIINTLQEFTNLAFVKAMAFTPDGKFLYCSNIGNVISKWEIAGGKQQDEILHQIRGIDKMAISADGNYLLTLSNYYFIARWELLGSKKPDFVQNKETQFKGVPYASDIAFYSVKEAIGVGVDSTNNIIKTWLVGDTKEWNSFSKAKVAFDRAVFSPDGRFLAGLAKDGTITVWETESGIEIATAKLPDLDEATAFSLFNNGKIILAGYKDGSIKLWEFES
jgi:beta-lactamase class A